MKYLLLIVSLFTASTPAFCQSRLRQDSSSSDEVNARWAASVLTRTAMNHDGPRLWAALSTGLYAQGRPEATRTELLDMYNRYHTSFTRNRLAESGDLRSPYSDAVRRYSDRVVDVISSLPVLRPVPFRTTLAALGKLGGTGLADFMDFFENHTANEQRQTNSRGNSFIRGYSMDPSSSQSIYSTEGLVAVAGLKRQIDQNRELAAVMGDVLDLDATRNYRVNYLSNPNLASYEIVRELETFLHQWSEMSEDLRNQQRDASAMLRRLLSWTRQERHQGQGQAQGGAPAPSAILRQVQARQIMEGGFTALTMVFHTIDPQVGRAVQTIGSATTSFYDAMLRLPTDTAGLGSITASAIFSGSLLQVGLSLMALFQGPQVAIQNVILDEVRDLRSEIRTLHSEMHQRFDIVDMKLDRILTLLQAGFDRVLLRQEITEEFIRGMARQISSVEHFMHSSESRAILRDLEGHDRELYALLGNCLEPSQYEVHSRSAEASWLSCFTQIGQRAFNARVPNGTLFLTGFSEDLLEAWGDHTRLGQATLTDIDVTSWTAQVRHILDRGLALPFLMGIRERRSSANSLDPRSVELLEQAAYQVLLAPPASFLEQLSIQTRNRISLHLNLLADLTQDIRSQRRTLRVASAEGIPDMLGDWLEQYRRSMEEYRQLRRREMGEWMAQYFANPFSGNGPSINAQSQTQAPNQTSTDLISSHPAFGIAVTPCAEERDVHSELAFAGRDLTRPRPSPNREDNARPLQEFSLSVGQNGFIPQSRSSGIQPSFVQGPEETRTLMALLEEEQQRRHGTLYVSPSELHYQLIRRSTAASSWRNEAPRLTAALRGLPPQLVRSLPDEVTRAIAMGLGRLSACYRYQWQKVREEHFEFSRPHLGSSFNVQRDIGRLVLRFDLTYHPLQEISAEAREMGRATASILVSDHRLGENPNLHYPLGTLRMNTSLEVPFQNLWHWEPTSRYPTSMSELRSSPFNTMDEFLLESWTRGSIVTDGLRNDEAATFAVETMQTASILDDLRAATRALNTLATRRHTVPPRSGRLQSTVQAPGRVPLEQFEAARRKISLFKTLLMITFQEMRTANATPSPTESRIENLMRALPTGENLDEELAASLQPGQSQPELPAPTTTHGEAALIEGILNLSRSLFGPTQPTDTTSSQADHSLQYLSATDPRIDVEDMKNRLQVFLQRRYL